MTAGTHLQNIAGAIAQAKKCFAIPSGFYMKINDRSVEVQCIKDPSESDDILSLDYGIVLKIAQLASNPNVLCAPCPTGDVSISERLEVYYGGCSLATGGFIDHQGHISSIQTNSKEFKTFTVVGQQLSECAGGPVFTYDEVNKVLNLAGVILSQEEESSDGSCQAVHIDMIIKDPRVQKFLLEQEESSDTERGKTRVAVANGDFKGIEQGNGRGPRSILINGAGTPVTYNLTFIGDRGKPLNPHRDSNYKGKEPAFYQDAIDAFVQSYNTNQQQVPGSFTFMFHKTEYTASQ